MLSEMEEIDEKSTSEIWVNSLEIDKVNKIKSNSDGMMKHYSRLPEIFTRF